MVVIVAALGADTLAIGQFEEEGGSFGVKRRALSGHQTCLAAEWTRRATWPLRASVSSTVKWGWCPLPSRIIVREVRWDMCQHWAQGWVENKVSGIFLHAHRLWSHKDLALNPEFPTAHASSWERDLTGSLPRCRVDTMAVAVFSSFFPCSPPPSSPGLFRKAGCGRMEGGKGSFWNEMGWATKPHYRCDSSQWVDLHVDIRGGLEE